ncbi:hypothetical protein GN244_ATG13824 [Phytophthora infestans]|uniref:Uncharacterized protein n=1 Tax=Phytophthora infestans TaxID=4787 RepID=A0A833RVG3_PHYIN|nr:hypothetical protein GN244_ATG13824 [Phytophthora infestans]KAF4127888.1 hypothetical protein GN958_ATG22944 [Phytophthora infestans]
MPEPTAPATHATVTYKPRAYGSATHTLDTKPLKACARADSHSDVSARHEAPDAYASETAVATYSPDTRHHTHTRHRRQLQRRTRLAQGKSEARAPEPKVPATYPPDTRTRETAAPERNLLARRHQRRRYQRRT